MSSSQTLLQRAQYVLVTLAGVYGLILALATVPWVQREFAFLNWIRFPFFPDYDAPQAYGLAPFKTRNLYIPTPDGETLGAWHVLPNSIYLAQAPFPPHGPLDNATFDDAFGARPTVLYFHGNAATRATPQRVRTYSALSGRLDVNVLAIDYRGFADSTGTPSEAGLVIDARTAWDWIAQRVVAAGKTPEKNIVVMGHSLGTGVAAALAGQLAETKTYPRAVVLATPFTSITDMLSSFYVFGIIPVLSPFKAFPSIMSYYKSHMSVKFDSVQALSHTASPTLILHTVVDDIVPHSHSEELFNSLLTQNGAAKRAPKVHEMVYDGWGTIRYANPLGRKVLWWEGEHGGHNEVGWTEGTMDLIAEIARL